MKYHEFMNIEAPYLRSFALGTHADASDLKFSKIMGLTYISERRLSIDAHVGYSNRVKNLPVKFRASDHYYDKDGE